MNFNPIQYHMRPLFVSDQDFMGARIRQDKDFVNNRILDMMYNDRNLLPALLQQAQIIQHEERRDKRLLYDVSFYIVPAEQVRVYMGSRDYKLNPNDSKRGFLGW